MPAGAGQKRECQPGPEQLRQLRAAADVQTLQRDGEESNPEEQCADAGQTPPREGHVAGTGSVNSSAIVRSWIVSTSHHFAQPMSSPHQSTGRKPCDAAAQRRVASRAGFVNCGEHRVVGNEQAGVETVEGIDRLADGRDAIAAIRTFVASTTISGFVV